MTHDDDFDEVRAWAASAAMFEQSGALRVAHDSPQPGSAPVEDDIVAQVREAADRHRAQALLARGSLGGPAARALQSDVGDETVAEVLAAAARHRERISTEDAIDWATAVNAHLSPDRQARAGIAAASPAVPDTGGAVFAPIPFQWAGSDLSWPQGVNVVSTPPEQMSSVGDTGYVHRSRFVVKFARAGRDPDVVPCISSDDVGEELAGSSRVDSVRRITMRVVFLDACTDAEIIVPGSAGFSPWTSVDRHGHRLRGRSPGVAPWRTRLLRSLRLITSAPEREACGLIADLAMASAVRQAWLCGASGAQIADALGTSTATVAHHVRCARSRWDTGPANRAGTTHLDRTDPPIPGDTGWMIVDLAPGPAVAVEQFPSRPLVVRAAGVAVLTAAITEPGPALHPEFGTAEFAAGVGTVADLKPGWVLDGVVTEGLEVDVARQRMGLPLRLDDEPREPAGPGGGTGLAVVGAHRHDPGPASRQGDEVFVHTMVAESPSPAFAGLFDAPGALDSHLARIRRQVEEAFGPAVTKAQLLARAIREGLIDIDAL